MEVNMSTGEFRFAFFARDYEATLAFYRDGLELPIVGSWDRGPDARGTLLSAASGIIEVLGLPQHPKDTSVWDYNAPQGVMMVIETDDVDAWYGLAVDKDLPIREELTNQKWGHRSFRLTDPNGITLYIFSKTG